MSPSLVEMPMLDRDFLRIDLERVLCFWISHVSALVLMV